MTTPEAALITRRAVAFTPKTLDRTKRTVEAVVSTGADVPRPGFTERLDLSGADMSRMIGAPVLNAHRQGSITDALGVVESARMEGGRMIATLRFSRRPEADAVMDDIEDGVIRGVSLGYSVQAWKETRDANGGPVRIAARWTPVEVSLVPLPADPGATVRSLDMPEPTPQPAPAPNPAPPAPPATETRAASAEEVRAIAQIARLDDGFVTTQTTAGATVEQARAAAFLAMQSAQPPIRTVSPSVGPSNDDPAVINKRMGEALFARINPTHQLSEPARAYYGLTMPEIGREILRRAGVPTTGMGPATIITRALHTTSDFSAILGDTVGRTMRTAYGAAPSGLKPLARMTTARDFRAKHRIQLGEFPTLERVNEAGEFKSGTMAEAKETYAVESFGRIIGISYQAMVNDDLGAFTDLSARIGTAAAAFEADQLVKKLEANPAMSDGKTLFHADHGNISANELIPFSAPFETTPLEAARLAMRKQTGLSGDLIAVTPRYVLAPAELETGAEKLLSAIQANRVSDANPFSTLSLVIDPRLTSPTRWYMAADPAQIDGLEYAYLEGAEGPQIESRNGFEVDGVQIKVRLVFGCGFVDWRGWHRSTPA